MDNNRLIEQVELYDRENISDEPSSDLLVKRQLLDQEDRQILWEKVNSRLHNKKEVLVLYGSFILGLKPRELYELFRNKLEDINDVYRTLQNMLARL